MTVSSPTPGPGRHHYVVLSYCLELDDDQTLQPPAEQHQQYRWWPQDELRFSSRVHKHTRAYF